MINFEALKVIESADPDGGEREPTDADYARHKAWAVESFGLDTWEHYQRGGWGDGIFDDEPRHVEY
jgi:hypothetical protein